MAHSLRVSIGTEGYNHLLDFFTHMVVDEAHEDRRPRGYYASSVAATPTTRHHAPPLDPASDVDFVE